MKKHYKMRLSFSVTPEVHKRIKEFCAKSAFNMSKKTQQLWTEFMDNEARSQTSVVSKRSRKSQTAANSNITK